MAFGDALRPQDGATVVLNVDTSQTQKLEQAEAQWRQSVGVMSREAIRLDLAQERLRTSLQKYGAESAQAKRATIGLKDAEEAAARSADKLTRETTQLNSAQDRQRRGLSSTTKGVIGLAGAYFGVHGLIAGVRTAVSAYREQEVVEGQTRIGVNALGLEYDKHADKIERVIRAVSQLGFDDEALMQSFLKLVRGTKDVDVALERMALSAGVARGTFKDLEFGTGVVVKAQLGMAGALRRAGLDVEKNATRTELLTFLTEQFGQAAVKAADDGAVAGERFSVEWENLQEILGSGVSPALADVSDRLADYLGDAENQAEVQRRVNEAVETGEDVVRGLAGAFRIAHRAISPFVSLVGGAENAVKLLVLAMVVGKVLSFASALRLIGTNASFARRQLTTLAAASNAPMGAGLAGLNPLLLIAGLGAVGYYGATNAESGPDFNALLSAAYAGQLSLAQVRRLGPFLSEAQERQLIAAIKSARGGAIPNADREDRAATAKAGAAPKPKPGGSGTTGASGPTESDLLLEVARPGNERADLERLRAFYARQIRALEARKRLTEAQKEELRRLYGDIAGVQSQIDAIEEEARAKDEERDRKREEAQKKETARQKAAMDRAMRAAEERGRLLRGTGGSRENMRRAALAGVQGTIDRLKKENAQKGLTEAEIRRLHVEFLTGLQGVTNQFGSNISPDTARMATEATTQTWLMREVVRSVNRLSSSVAHPGAKYVRTEYGALVGGVGSL